MKNSFVSVLIFITTFTVNAQHFVVSNSKENTLYLGIENPMQAMVEKMKCGTFILSTDNGKIIDKQNCRYIARRDSIGVAILEIRKVKGRDTTIIGKAFFNVKEIPKPIATIAGKRSGIIDKKLLIASGGILNHFENFDFDLLIPVTFILF
ncbi:MAG: hypothetical protein ACOYO1_09625 [Bacteroidales bacterium]